MKSSPNITDDELAKAVQFEKSNVPKEAAKLYEGLLRQQSSNEKILTRLIINYRKLKDYKKELKHINSLIKVHQSFYSPQNRKGAIVISISEKINKSLGATDKKGNTIYTDDAIKKLEKRKVIVEKKVKKM